MCGQSTSEVKHSIIYVLVSCCPRHGEFLAKLLTGSGESRADRPLREVEDSGDVLECRPYISLVHFLVQCSLLAIPPGQLALELCLLRVQRLHSLSMTLQTARLAPLLQYGYLVLIRLYPVRHRVQCIPLLRDCSSATGFIPLGHDEVMQGFVAGLRRAL